MRHLTRRSFLISATAAPVALAALPAFAQHRTHEVTIARMTFSPQELHISPGDSVLFVNNDRAPHLVRVDDGGETDRLNPGQSDSMTFLSPGTRHYECTIHPSMSGQIFID